MDSYSIVNLPPELLIQIIEDTPSRDLTNLCNISKEYNVLCAQEYDELWYILFNRLVNPIPRYADIQEYNQINRTKYRNWREAYLDIRRNLESLNYGSFRNAVTNGHIELVKVLIPILEYYIFSEDLRTAIEKGYTDIVRLLLTQTNVDPSNNLNIGIRRAASKGYTDIVRLLLQDPRVDPASEIQEALRQAVDHKHVEVVKLLLQNPRVNPNVYQGAAIKSAAGRGNIEILRLLIQHPQTDIYSLQEGLVEASENCKAESVRVLLEDDRVNPSYKGNEALIRAAENRCNMIVELLMLHPRFDYRGTWEAESRARNKRHTVTANLIERLFRERRERMAGIIEIN